MEAALPPRFPNIVPQSKRQMKDVENVATMLLFIETGERSLSQADIDKAFGEREEEWSKQEETVAAFLAAIGFIKEIMNEPGAGAIHGSRLRNQADFYSLFAAIVELQRNQECPSSADAAARLIPWLTSLRDIEPGRCAHQPGARQKPLSRCSPRRIQ